MGAVLNRAVTRTQVAACIAASDDAAFFAVAANLQAVQHEAKKL
jgi:hypothetical protein